jgi:hypothetical protein
MLTAQLYEAVEWIERTGVPVFEDDPGAGVQSVSSP